MPIYEYVCMSCESHFEELVRHDDESPKCPECGAVKVQRQLSVFSATKAKPTPVKSGGGPAPFGGCGHGSCGCH
jgi:putative FmdB family regulatory protein